MATETLTIPPSNQILPGSRLLVTTSLPTGSSESTTNAEQKPSPESFTSQWLSNFHSLLQGKSIPAKDVFLSGSGWRDLLCMTWDYRSLQGPEAIDKFVHETAGNSKIMGLELDKSAPHRAPALSPFGSLEVIQAFLKVETTNGKGRGLLKLYPDEQDDGKWKALTLFTTLEEIKGHEESILDRRPTGLDRRAEEQGVNWQDRRTAQQNLEAGGEPTVLIIGAGQGGLTSAARLKQLGIESLIIDRKPRIGDNWRDRYHGLVLHDSVWYDHLPYLQFPPNWPVFTPKDKLADWFEYYAGILELNVWMSSSIEKSSWSDTDKHWTITLARERNGTKELREIHPKHVVLATGHSGRPYFPSGIKGLSDFKGDRLIHSSQFTQPSKQGTGKKAIVVGSCNSGHDIARDYHDHGYDVTMVQRSSTLVVTSDTLMEGQKGVYSEDGPPVDDADILTLGTPNAVAKQLHIAATAQAVARDSSLLSRLQAAGFACDSGPDASGIWMKYLSRGGGYYIDVGCSQLIADKKIRIAQGRQISHVTASSLVLEDGTELPADEIVFATGYQNMRETAREILGDAVADRTGDVWGFNEEGEIRGMWRRSGHPGFWYFGGNLALCRFYSRLLALQILGIESGLTTA